MLIKLKLKHRPLTLLSQLSRAFMTAVAASLSFSRRRIPSSRSCRWNGADPLRELLLDLLLDCVHFEPIGELFHLLVELMLIEACQSCVIYHCAVVVKVHKKVLPNEIDHVVKSDRQLLKLN